MKRGFSLIEIIVSVGIFAIVMTVALGALLSINLANKRAQSVRIVLDNVNFALESMARELRLGQKYHCGTDVAGSSGTAFATQDCATGTGIAFIASVGGIQKQFQYRFNKTDPVDNCPKASVCVSVDGGEFFPLTSPGEIAIDNLDFVVTGAETPLDKKQPQVIIRVSGTDAGNRDPRATFKIQTTVMQRSVDTLE